MHHLSPTGTDCPVCGGTPEPLHRGRPASADPVPRAEAYTIARMSYGTPFPVTRCSGCGLGRALVPYDRPEVLEVYRQGEDPAYPQEEAGRRATFRRGLERLRPHLPAATSTSGALAPGVRRPRLLDIGASTGFLVAEARDLGFDVVGLEPSRWAAAEARRRFGVEVIESGLETAGLPDSSFDVVTLVDVIEHFTDPFAALAEIGRVLKPGGVLYVVTPDLGSFAARMLGRRWWGFEPWHLWYFQDTSLTRALVGAGFTVAEVGSYSRTFSFGYWLEKCRGLSRPLFAIPVGLARLAGIATRPVTVDLRDTLEVVATRTMA